MKEKLKTLYKAYEKAFKKEDDRNVLSIINEILILQKENKDKFKEKNYKLMTSKLYFNSALVYMKLKDIDKSLKYLDKAIEKNKRYSKAYFNKAIILEDLNELDEALKAYNKAIIFNPKDHTYIHNRALLKVKLEKFKEAIMDFNQAIQLKPDNYKSYYDRAILELQLNMFKLAIKDFDSAKKINNKKYELYHNRAIAKASIDEFDEALADLNTALKIKHDLNVYKDRASIYYILKEYDKAIYDLKIIIDQKDNYFDIYEVYNQIALCYYNKKKDEENYHFSLFYFKLCIYKKDSEYYFDFAMLYHKYNKMNEAIELLNNAIELDNQDYRFYNNRGSIYFNKKLFKKALGDFEKTIKLNPDFIQAYSNRNICISKLRNTILVENKRKYLNNTLQNKKDLT